MKTIPDQQSDSPSSSRREFSNDVRLRKAMETDCQRVLQWRNDPKIVSLSSSKRTIDQQEHRKWFYERIHSDDCLFYIIEDDTKPVGVLRFDNAGDQEWIVTIYIQSNSTGRGCGKKAIRMAIQNLYEQKLVKSIVAIVRKDNEVAHHAFQSYGFELRTVSGGEQFENSCFEFIKGRASENSMQQ